LPPFRFVSKGGISFDGFAICGAKYLFRFLATFLILKRLLLVNFSFRAAIGETLSVSTLSKITLVKKKCQHLFAMFNTILIKNISD